MSQYRLTEATREEMLVFLDTVTEANEMKCDNCERDPIEAGALHRASPKGELPAIWLCAECGGRSPKDVQDIIDAIRQEKARRPPATTRREPPDATMRSWRGLPFPSLGD